VSEKWLEIQSFLEDQDILTAINDLSLATKQRVAGVLRARRAERAGAAKEYLRHFMTRLEEFLASPTGGAGLAVDPRFRQLAEGFEAARRDPTHYRSTLMRQGIKSTLALLDRKDPTATESLLESLSELRSLVSQHQQVDAEAIFEDF
jgi:hypothetical protein